jgi:aspartate-semialdehyde dehydrogenase
MARVCVLGAHTAVARALGECIEERDVEVELRRTTLTEHLEGELEIASEEILRASDLAILAMRGAEGKKLAEAAMRLGKGVLDLVEAFADDKRAVWIFPGVDPEAGRSFDPQRPSVVPIGLGVPIIAVLRALAPLRPTRATVATSESVAALDQPGMDELSEQVRARFNMRDVEPKVLGGTIAFGCIPLVGVRGESWSDADERLRVAIERGTERELPDIDLTVSRILVPTFSADSAVVVVDFDESPSEEEVNKRLHEARGLHVFDAEETPSSFEAIGRDDALVGRLAVDEGRATFWIASDRLRRGSATLAVLALERWLEK